MKKILSFLFGHKTLDRTSAKEVLINISKGMYNESEIASFTTVFLMRSITIDELQGFRDALMELCVPINFSDHQVLDIVGTGGDGKNTFNISTLSSFIAAGTGNKVAIYIHFLMQYFFNQMHKIVCERIVIIKN